MKANLARLKRYTWALATVWTIVVIASLIWNLSAERWDALQSARIEARTAHTKDVVYRLWNARHGGVYVPVTPDTPPNPYLDDVPERDITTPSGRQLTLINPAYMTRQAHELGEKEYGIHAHITSLKPIRPENAPDPWETKALQRFEHGESEVSSVEEIEGEKYMRLMRPLFTKKACLRCHAKQGYKLGDIRGGISVAVPMAPLETIARKHATVSSIVCLLLWLIGLTGLAFVARRLKKRIEERNRAVEELQDLSVRHQTILDEAPDIIMEVDRNKVYTWANPAGYEFFGDDVIGKEAAFYFEGKQDTYEKAQSHFNENTDTYYIESWQRRRDGEKRLLAWWRRALKGPEGQVIGALSTARDITEQKQTEKERERLEAQLRQAQKMEVVGQLAGGVAHDFNNLLTGIIGNVSLAEMKSSDKVRKYLTNASQAADRAARLVQQLLAFARKSRLEFRPVDINQIVNEVAQLTRKTIDRRIEIAVHAQDDLPNILADAAQINSVLMNLVINARDAINEVTHGRVAPERRGDQFVISLETEITFIDKAYCENHAYARPGRFVIISVSDNGAGMDTETQRRVFEPFFTTKEIGKGTGLGLASVYGIIKQHDGWINLYSELGKGTAFKIYLPTVDEKTPETKMTGIQKIRSGTETILLVDDEEVIRHLGREILERYGYTTRLASDGQEALNIYQKERERIDLVILDLSMPRLSGRETLEQLQKIDPDVRVIVSSGYSENGQVAPFDDLGAAAFISKPYHPEALARTVREVLDK